ncbi:hypothetical protein [Desulfocurvibacter africanus]|uniref:Uncharacterized protein n=1 Tax=Desulfocurvibacter africanus subsp. africanus str. Walvis Bay TaxID=690850 RepID=F3YWU4_DESAF|nr:hypothetical protein [Desulfocurvibacter africanus]EGJ51668.1 hypothetical protein Desaf_3381 [Desulfocurvibacter africanus subsp. africanus str. Walvis Bay]
MIKLLFKFTILFLILHAPLSEAHGLVIYGGKSVADLGMYVAEVTYFPYTDTEAELTVTMCNLSGAVRGCRITGFAVVNPYGRIEHIAPGSDFPAAFQVFGAARRASSVKTMDEFGASLGSDLPERLDLASGLPPDQAARATAFRFLLTGRGLYSLKETDFVPDAGNITSVNTGGSREGRCFFAVRYADAQEREHILGRANYWLR